MIQPSEVLFILEIYRTELIKAPTKEKHNFGCEGISGVMIGGLQIEVVREKSLCSIATNGARNQQFYFFSHLCLMFAEKSGGKCLFQGLEPEKTYSSHHSAPRILNLSDCGKPTKKKKVKNTERRDLEFNFLILLLISSSNKQILPTETPKNK